MPRLEPTPQLLQEILIRIPEGFIRHDMLCQRLKLSRDMTPTLVGEVVANEGDWWYDMSRITREALHECKKWGKAVFPEMHDGEFAEAPIAERIRSRAARLQSSGNPVAMALLERMAASSGYMNYDSLGHEPDEFNALDLLIIHGDLVRIETLVYDPLRLGAKSARAIIEQQRWSQLKARVTNFLSNRNSQTVPRAEVDNLVGAQNTDGLIRQGALKVFQVQGQSRNAQTIWVRLPEADAQMARDAAVESLRTSWESLVEQAGKLLRPGTREGKTSRMKVIARTYTLGAGAHRLGIRPRTLEKAIQEGRISAFEDPEGHLRLAAEDIEAALQNPEYGEHLTTYEPIALNDLALVLEVNPGTLRRRIQKAGIGRSDPLWGQIRGEWGLPETYQEYRLLLNKRKAVIAAERDEQRREHQRQLEEERKKERERRATLRARLLAAFPTWRHDGRAEQRIVLHVGPPNSGKTYASLQALAEAGSGWYLAPLRLLAFEIFDRLNQQGTLCNLLTGEEYIPVFDAPITSATVEMFNPRQSGRCVVIDEAQMLADADRGWAWTRALMEAEAPEIHVIGPDTARGLIEQMASAAAMPIEVIEHKRLAPIRVAEHAWPLTDLPSRTILVAFSRQTVLHLKTELERMKRTVSVVYGNLPPEVRRKQADRFANGETEICVATDAVGMGLNLPADYVCFYEIEKFDGRNNRQLMPAEVQQIGGRAGRFGISQAGEVGATSKRDLRIVRKLFFDTPEILTHARVAPTVEDLEMIPGNLASKLTQWASLQSIPDSLRNAIQTSDMTERIELASMLTDREVNLLGLEAALKLVNAPTRQNTRDYWYQCARAILTGKDLPIPPVAPREITNTIELESIEYSIACADIYLWLSQRREFADFGRYEADVRGLRGEWSTQIDEALLRRINTFRRCNRCGAPLPLKHRFSICDNCFRGRINTWSP
jgi:hypothetical protein